jgi:hypothetical protein
MFRRIVLRLELSQSSRGVFVSNEDMCLHPAKNTKTTPYSPSISTQSFQSGGAAGEEPGESSGTT